MIREVQLPLEEDLAAAGAGLAVGVVAQRVVGPESFRRLAAPHAARQVVLLVDHVVPDRLGRALVVDVVGLDGDVGHARVRVDRPHGVADRLVLLLDGQVALVVFGAVLAAVEQELRQGDVPVAGAGLRSRFPLDLVHEAAEPDESLLHLLVPVVPRLLRRGADVIRPAVAELLGRVVQTEILAFRHHVVVDRRLDEVAGDVALVIPPVGHGPPLQPGSPPAGGRLVGGAARRAA